MGSKRKLNITTYSRTLPDRTRAEHRARMAVRRTEQLLRKVTRTFRGASKLYPYMSKRQIERASS